MKFNKLFSAVMLIVAALVAACSAPPEPVNPNDKENQNNPTVAGDTTAIPASITIPEGAITVSQARELCAALENNAVSEQFYYVHGWIKKLHSANTEAITGDYHNAQFYMAENQIVSGNNVAYDSDDFYAYRVKGPENSGILDPEAVQVGDYVVLYCKLTKYNDTYETPMNSGSYIYASTNPKLVSSNQPITDAVDVTVAEAIEKAKAKDPGNFRVTVTVVNVKTDKSKVPGTYTNINMTVKDETGEIDCFYTNYLDNKPFTSAEQIPPVGTKLKVVGPVTMYKAKDSEVETPEFKEGYIEEIIELGDGSGDLITDAVEVTIAQAIEKAKAKDPGNFKCTAIVKEVKTAAANVPSKYTNINMTIKDETGEIDCFYTNYLENKPFTSAEQIPPVGTKLVIVGPLTLYNDETPEFKNGYIEQILEIGEGVKIEGDIVLLIENKIDDWVYSDTTANPKAEYYGNGGLKLNKEKASLTSPVFTNEADALLVEFKIGALNVNQATGKNGADGNNFLVEGLNEAGEVIASKELKTNKADSYFATLNEKGIVKVRLTMVSFPYNGTKYCNVNLSYVAISYLNGEPAGE